MQASGDVMPDECRLLCSVTFLPTPIDMDNAIGDVSTQIQDCSQNYTVGMYLWFTKCW